MTTVHAGALAAKPVVCGDCDRPLTGDNEYYDAQAEFWHGANRTRLCNDCAESRGEMQDQANFDRQFR